MLRTWLREPLLHFLLLGAALFGAYAWLERGAGPDAARTSRVVRVTAAQVEWLAETWARQWQRPPTEPELRGLVADYLREEFLASEARELGLDDDDTIVRRRLAQKMEFLFEGTARVAEPSEGELVRFFEENRERYRTEGRISLRHVYFNPDRRGAAVASDAAAALARLSQPSAPAVDPAELGDPSLLERDFEGLGETAVASLFGEAFARAVFALEPGAWRGPVESGYGLHLVRVTAKEPGRVRPFAEVRAKVLEDWHRRRREVESERYFAALLAKYEVVADDAVKPLVGPLAPAAEAAR